MRRRKGVIDIEFLVSILVFLTALSFVALSIINTIPRLHQESLDQILKSKSYQISEVLFFDEGWPTAWDSGDIDNTDRLGLSSGERYFIHTNKANQLESWCNNPNTYLKIKNKLGLDFRNDLMINITDDSNTVVDCRPSVVSQIRPKSVTTRVGVDSVTGNLLVMRIGVL